MWISQIGPSTWHPRTTSRVPSCAQEQTVRRIQPILVEVMVASHTPTVKSMDGDSGDASIM